MVLLKSFRNIFKITELRSKIFFVVIVLIINRLGTYIPVIGVDVARVAETLQQSASAGGLLRYFDLFSGGALARCTVFGLGIAPYITASIMLQILGMTVPTFEQLLKEGEYGRKIINQYTRYVTLGLSLVYGMSFAWYIENNGLALTPGWGFRLIFTLTLAAGSMLVMWMGDQISLHGIGNGSSVILFSNLVSGYPAIVLRLIHRVQEGQVHFIMSMVVLAIFLAITALVVFLEKSERKVPIQYTRRIVGNKMYAGQSTHIPFKINSAGVMPVIFASTILTFPMMVGNLLSGYLPALKTMVDAFNSGPLYHVSEFILVIIFSFVYTALAVNPEELAEHIRKGGGFIPGLRPGKNTAQYFNYILTRIGLVGAIYLATLSILPAVLQQVFNVPFEMSGTSMLIVVGVALELSSQIESYLIEHKYEGFLSSGRVKRSGALS